LGAGFYREHGNNSMAALLLHQACEHLYQCVLWSLTLHGADSDEVGHLFRHEAGHRTDLKPATIPI
jgi:hypothetical protein